MREIKFRAWLKEEGEMHVVEWLTFNNPGGWVFGHFSCNGQMIEEEVAWKNRSGK